MPLGIYLSVPFCRTKCTYCNFASDVFSRAVFERYVQRVCSDLDQSQQTALAMNGQLDSEVDSIYLGGGTPTVLDIAQLERLFVNISQNFQVADNAEITVECAPGTLTDDVISSFVRCRVNRVSLGAQSFVDAEAASVGRLHKRSTVADDVTRLRDAGILNINIDLLAGLPHQTADSWEVSLQHAIASGVPHISVYMLEVDEDSRLGRELIAGGTRYHAHFVPDEDLTAQMYEAACGRLNSAGILQYEISNFARRGYESRHNLKYWTRQPYMGFGVDAHSMLHGAKGGDVRFSTSDSLEAYTSGAPFTRTEVTPRATLEEEFFLGLRLVSGIDLDRLKMSYGNDAIAQTSATVAEFESLGLMQRSGSILKLTPRGRLLSNEVFERFITVSARQPAEL